MTTPRRLRRPEPKRESRMANLSKIVQSIAPGCTDWQLRRISDGFAGMEATQLVIDESTTFTVGREWASLA